MLTHLNIRDCATSHRLGVPNVGSMGKKENSVNGGPWGRWDARPRCQKRVLISKPRLIASISREEEDSDAGRTNANQKQNITAEARTAFLCFFFKKLTHGNFKSLFKFKCACIIPQLEGVTSPYLFEKHWQCALLTLHRLLFYDYLTS